MASLRSTPKKPRPRPNAVEPQHSEHHAAASSKRRLRMPTVIRRLRLHLDSGNKINAVKQAKKDAGYSLHEALRLVQHCEGDHGLTNEELAFSWCGSCRNSLSACECAVPANEPPEATSAECEDATAGQREEAGDAQPFNCKCGDRQCENEWHRLAMWLEQDPANNYRTLLAYVEEQVAGAAADDGRQHDS